MAQRTESRCRAVFRTGTCPGTCCYGPAGASAGELGGQPDEVELRADAELGVDAGQMALDGAFADVKAAGHLPGGEPLGGQRGHFPLPAGERAGAEDRAGGPATPTGEGPEDLEGTVPPPGGTHLLEGGGGPLEGLDGGPRSVDAAERPPEGQPGPPGEDRVAQAGEGVDGLPGGHRTVGLSHHLRLRPAQRGQAPVEFPVDLPGDGVQAVGGRRRQLRVTGFGGSLGQIDEQRRRERRRPHLEALGGDGVEGGGRLGRASLPPVQHRLGVGGVVGEEHEAAAVVVGRRRLAVVAGRGPRRRSPPRPGRRGRAALPGGGSHRWVSRLIASSTAASVAGKSPLMCWANASHVGGTAGLAVLAWRTASRAASMRPS